MFILLLFFFFAGLAWRSKCSLDRAVHGVFDEALVRPTRSQSGPLGALFEASPGLVWVLPLKKMAERMRWREREMGIAGMRFWGWQDVVPKSSFRQDKPVARVTHRRCSQANAYFSVLRPKTFNNSDIRSAPLPHLPREWACGFV